MTDSMAMIRAITHNDVESLQSLLVNGYVLGQDIWQEKGFNELHYAAQNLQVESCRVLLDHGADPNARDADGRTPLWWTLISATAFNKRYAVSETLLNAGANPNILDNKFQSPLHKMLTSGENTVTVEPKATLAEAMRLLALLVAHGANPSGKPASPAAGYLTPFQLAVKEGFVVPVKFLIEQCAEDLAQRTAGGRTLMQVAKKSEMKALLRSAKTTLAVENAVLDRQQVAAPAVAARSAGMSPL